MAKYTTLQSVNDVLQRTSGDDPSLDRLIKRYIRVASDAFEKAAGASFEYKEDITDKIGSKGSIYLHGLSTLPLKEITEIRYKDHDPVDPDTYEIEGYMIRRNDRNWRDTSLYHRGFITPRRDAYNERKDYLITYNAGYVTPSQEEDDPSLERDLPYDLEEGIISYATYLFLNSDRNEGISSESTDQWSISYVGDGVKVPSTFKEVVNQYRVLRSL